MSNIKQAPFLGLTGMGGGGTGLALGGAVAKKTYIDDVFSTYVYTGNESARSINNGVDLSGRGGLVWVKSRNDTHQHHLVDTERGSNKVIYSDSHIAESTIANRITGFNDNGFNLGSAGQVNGTSSYDYAGWSLAKAKGFLDIVTWTGNATNSSSPPRDIAHDLGCVPGAIWVKCLTANQSWACYHKSLGATRYMHLSDSGAGGTSVAWWNNTEPTSTHFTVGYDGQVNENNQEYVAYVFAGGESTAATARSINFNGSSDYLSVPTSPDYDFGTGDFTIECWIKADTFGNINGFISKHYGASSSWQFYTDGSGDTSTLKFVYQRSDGGGSATFTGGTVERGQWTHVAVARNGSKLKLFVNGLMSEHDMVSELRDPSSPVNVLIGTEYIGGSHSNQYYFDGQISNVRIVKGTAVYTSSFRPSYEPLTSITNTKLLCCQSSTITAATTIATGSITAGDAPNALADSPFDDPNGFKFGEGGDQNLIKTGSYVGNGSATAGPEINLGWEAQWFLTKRTNGSADWILLDSMRGMPTGETDPTLAPNSSGAEGTGGGDLVDVSATGIKLKTAYDTVNGNGDTYIFLAIRRPDGYVGKPPSLGTDVFNMPLGLTDGTKPAFNTGFPVDFLIFKKPAASGDWFTGARMMGPFQLFTNKSDDQDSNPNILWDFQDGMGGWSGLTSGYQSWGFKRHAGFDVCSWTGDGVQGRQIPHNLGPNNVPEMIWVKTRSQNSQNWMVGHKGLDGGTNPWEKYINLNTDGSENDYPVWNDQAPTSTHFAVSSIAQTNASSETYIAMLFATTDVSAVGSYTGDGTSNGSHEITLGFTPRFLIIKCVTSGVSFSHWRLWDSLNGLDGSGNESYLKVNDTGAKTDGYDYIDTTSTGFKLNTAFGPVNGNGNKMIYYAHA